MDRELDVVVVGCGTAGTVTAVLLAAQGHRVPSGAAGRCGHRRWPAGDGLRVCLVVGADGTRSAVRRSLGVTIRDHPYSYGALWAVVPDPEEIAGDASHAMSPQLGAGASLALADAWTLAACLAEARDLRTGLTAYEQQRRAHVRWYTWWTRLMTPLFQSELVALSWPRNVLAGPVARVPVVRRQFISTLMGHRTSPWSTWQLPG